MKKIIKSRIFSFILGAVIFGSIGVFAYAYSANQITYTPKDSTWKKSNGEDITNIKDAVDELHNNLNKIIFTIASQSPNSGNTSLSMIEMKNFARYKYFKYVFLGNEGSNCENYFLDNETKVTATSNHTYSLSEIKNYRFYVKTSTTNPNGWCTVSVMFSN